MRFSIPKTYGQCAKQQCLNSRRRSDTDLCPTHNKERRNAKAYLKRREQRLSNPKSEYWRNKEEQGLALLERTKPERTRHKAYDDMSLTPVSNERAALLSRGTAQFWYLWLANRDNLCDKEALDRCGW
jgi:hypothetical protein